MGSSFSSKPDSGKNKKGNSDRSTHVGASYLAIWSYLANPFRNNIGLQVQLPSGINLNNITVNVAVTIGGKQDEAKQIEEAEPDGGPDNGEVEIADNGPVEVEPIDEETERAILLAAHPDVDWDNLAGEAEWLPNGLVSVRPNPNGIRLPRLEPWEYLAPDATEQTFQRVILEYFIGRRGGKISANIPYPLHVFMISALPGPFTRERHTAYVSSYKCQRMHLNLVTYRNNSSTTIRWVVESRQLPGARALLDPLGELQLTNRLDNASEVEFTAIVWAREKLV